MNAEAAGPGGRRWPVRGLVWLLVGAGTLVFVGANAHLVYVAVMSQPGCVAHSKVPGGQHEYHAAKSAC